jgi:O-antigen ligase
VTLLNTIQFLFGRGVGYLIALLASFCTLLASASRAGTLATLCGLLVMLTLAWGSGDRRSTRGWLLIGAFSIGTLLVVLFALSGGTLADRLNVLVDAGGIDRIRLSLWDAAGLMISSAPMLGLGLGSFGDSYPMYATKVLPFVMDKAHNDYLEFAAGLGLPAAIAWWTAWAVLAIDCVRGAFRRRHNQHFAILAAGATILVAVHSAFDFSLQIPAVSLSYVTLLGIGLAQTRSSRSKRSD